MNVLASECSSGCESGWTNYLEQSFLSANPSQKRNGFKDRKSGFCDEHREINRGKEEVEEEEEEEEEEDLSMVSDASSGPSHFYEDNIGYFNDQNNAPKVATLNKNGGNRQRNKEHRRRRKDQEVLPSFLDDSDTASSPLINFSKNNFVHTNNQASMESVFDYPQGFSATHFHQGGPALQDHFGFFLSSPCENQLQNNQFKWF
ncbi:hypothetical protein REPUB_Repub04eG0086100 [Reevesia pubescens]